MGTIPMPKPGYDAIVDEYNYEGKRLGNYATCSAQGFVVQVGMFASFSYHVGLWIYYLCTLRYKMQAETVRKRVEPFLHAISTLLPILVGAVAWSKKLFNVVPFKPF